MGISKQCNTAHRPWMWERQTPNVSLCDNKTVKVISHYELWSGLNPENLRMSCNSGLAYMTTICGRGCPWLTYHHIEPYAG